MKAIDWVLDTCGEDTKIFDNPSYDNSIIGVTTDGRVVYDYNKMIKYLMETDGMTYEDAEDFISYNTIRSLDYYENPPIVMYPMDEE